MKGTLYGHNVEIGEPHLWRKPKYSNPIASYSGKQIETTMFLPSGDGYKEVKVWVEDTPSGWLKHNNTQRRLLGQREVTWHQMYDLPIIEVWRIEVTWGVNEKAVLELPYDAKDDPRELQWRAWLSLAMKLAPTSGTRVR